eukprot:Sspe_Gene.15492::Locus_5393_Transcript_1_1_Confidence_1.000_Length_2138::g.15492::m.15492
MGGKGIVVPNRVAVACLLVCCVSGIPMLVVASTRQSPCTGRCVDHTCADGYGCCAGVCTTPAHYPLHAAGMTLTIVPLAFLVLIFVAANRHLCCPKWQPEVRPRTESGTPYHPFSECEAVHYHMQQKARTQGKCQEEEDMLEWETKRQARDHLAATLRAVVHNTVAGLGQETRIDTSDDDGHSKAQVVLISTISTVQSVEETKRSLHTEADDPAEIDELSAWEARKGEGPSLPPPRDTLSQTASKMLTLTHTPLSPALGNGGLESTPLSPVLNQSAKLGQARFPSVASHPCSVQL